MDEYTSPTVDEVRDILYNSKDIKWETVSESYKKKLIEDAMQSLDWKFGSWRGFSTFTRADLVRYINGRIPYSQEMRQIANGC